MSLLGNIGRRTRNKAKMPIPLGDGVSAARRGLTFNLGNGRQDAETFMRQYGMSGTIYGIISLLAETTATPSWHLYKKPPADGRVRYTTGDQGSDQRIEVVQHAAIQLLNSPNDWHTRFEYFEGSQQHEELTGETFWVLDAEAGFPTSMWYIRPDRMEPVPDAENYLLGWIYRGPSGEQVPLKTEEVILEKRPNPLDPYRGAGPVASIMPNIQQQRYATEYQRNLFLNGADPGGVITVPGNLNEPQFDELIDRWREAHRGVARAGHVGVLEGGATWTPNANSNKDMEYGQLRLANRDELREAWRIHKTMMGTSDDVNRCHDDQTEVLTADGWKPFEKVEDGDLIATVNPGTRYMEYHTPIRRFAYDYIGPMVRLHNKLVDVKVTPNHAMLINTPGRAPWRTLRADELPNRFNVLGAIEPVDGIEQPTFMLPAVEYANGHTGRGDAQVLPMDAWLEFLGWVISEGGILSEERAGGRYVMTLAQKKYPQRIRDCLAQLPFTSHEYDAADGCTRWNLAGKALISWLRQHVGTTCTDKRIPRWCLSLSVRQRSILFDAMMAGDGSYDRRPNRTNAYYATASPGLADDVLELAFSLGYRALVSPHRDERPLRAPMYYVHITRRNVAQVRDVNTTVEQYRGKVYSFEVPNHVYVTRRNGRIAVHGNSNSQTAQEVFVAWQTIPRLNRRRDTLNSKLLPLFNNADRVYEFDYDDPSPQNAEAAADELLKKTQSAQALVAAGYDPHDVLEVVGLPDMDFAAPAAPTAPPGLNSPDAAGIAAYRRQIINITPPPQPQPAPPEGQPPPAQLQTVDDQWKAAVAALVAAWIAHIMPSWIAALLGQIRGYVADGNIFGLGILQVDSGPAAVLILDHAAAYAAAAAEQAASEAAAQGVTGVKPAVPARADLEPLARTAAELQGKQVALSAGREAARVGAGPDADPEAVVTQVQAFLQGLSDASVTATAAGAMSAAQNRARLATITAGPRAQLKATELHDGNTCQPCQDIDGRVFGYSDDPAAVTAAGAAYPAGGYVLCEGGSRCRGTMWADYSAGKGVGDRYGPPIRAEQSDMPRIPLPEWLQPGTPVHAGAVPAKQNGYRPAGAR